MPDVYDRPECPPGCRGVLIGTCRIEHVDRGRKTGHETLFPARSVTELHALRRMKMEFWSIVRGLRDMCSDVVAFTQNASWRMLRPEFGQA
jgi:hypothetical protein